MIIETNVQTGEVTTRDYTPTELEAIAAAKAVWDADNTLDKRAIRAIDGLDRLQFEHLFNLENRTRVLELKTQITRLQYRDALINLWKSINQT